MHLRIPGRSGHRFR